jgi:aspartyl-tRNA(Asn)/glutamyl-tRNA(Gln) amidotransferase subunit C
VAIDKSEVEHVAHLARVSLAADELDTFTRQLGDILDYVNKLNEVDTSSVQPMEHTPHEGNVLREDAAAPSLGADKALDQAPKKAFDHFRVPKVVE